MNDAYQIIKMWVVLKQSTGSFADNDILQHRKNHGP